MARFPIDGWSMIRFGCYRLWPTELEATSFQIDPSHWNNVKTTLDVRP